MSGGGARVSIPGNVRKVIGEIKLIAAGKFNDEFINSLLKECGMDSNGVVERLKMIQEIKEIAKTHSNEDVHTMLKECNMDPNEAAQRLLYIDTFHEVKKKRDKRNVNVNGGTYEDYKRAPGKQWQGAKGGQGNYNPSYVSNDVGGRRDVSTWKENGVRNRNRNRSERVSSSTIPLQQNKENNLLPHMGSSSPIHANGRTMAPDGLSNRGSTTQQSAGKLGTEKVEVSNQSGISTPAVGNTGSVVQDVANTSETATDSLAVNSSTGSESSLNGTLKAVTTTVAGSEESNPKLEIKPEKLTLSPSLPVTFPDHLQVPETFKKRLTFGTLDAVLGDKNPSSSIDPVQGNDVRDASMSSQNVTSTVREDEVPSNSLLLQDVPDSALPSEPSDSSLTQEEQPNQETVPPQLPFSHSTTSYGFGLPPHYLGIPHPEIPENQSGNSLISSTSAATPYTAESNGTVQSPLSPPPFPLFRHPFAHAYYPYGPHYPHYYWPPNAHHLMGQGGGFPQQPYVPPSVKFPVPSPYMHGAYGSSSIGYPAADGTNEDVVASQTKEKSIKSAGQQGEDPHISATAPSREIPNYFYNLPQGQHMPFPPAFYHHHHHPSQIMAAAQSEPMASGLVETPVGPPPSKSYEQPQHAPKISWNVLNSMENI